jgi:hypothetical protein
MCVTFVCRFCGNEGPAEDFETEKRNSTGVTGRCRSCRSKHRKLNGDYAKERIRKYSYRKGDSALFMTVEDIERLLRKRKCSYCGTEMDGNSGEPTEATADHVYGIGSYGGANIAENLTCSCRGCNSAKRDRHVFDFYQSSDKFTDELWTQFVLDFTERLTGQKLTDEEVEQMKRNFEDEARDLRGVK